ncbi:membrane fusion protein, cobalt-zinc-cadmium efflux system [Hydrocarboniphaga daqingensis]|uniref:Membrane fusion protein, cobalt-zinc-cadmium efflux system n=1 Tax=Hydrocarboniphaga daqingensis TaxID=490188 RepID=A0A1M5PS29_9GAMM|nr:efflux RND transporter periplasmic adaptor subunit [Hydrocarboniphaga daqingensis]SHH04386.1 membrane fusion protein, cobalt-zinc-cadmium efflux system [Hydrocarboniphaga daqingensis]
MKCLTLFAAGLLAVVALTACKSQSEAASEPGQDAKAEAFERGPHRGRLLRDGDFGLELQIFEDGVPPEYHVYLFRNDQPLPPDAATVTVELTRLGNQVDRFTFSPRGEYLIGSGIVNEPHSFSVVVTATANGKPYRWAFDSFEGRTRIAAKIAADAGVKTEKAGPATIADTVTLTGRIVPNAEQVRAVRARFPGVIKSVAKSVGDRVSKGETLASVESNDSLQTYAVTSPIAGIVVERHANTGEGAGSDPLFVIADYAQLWAELSLFPRDLQRVKVGQMAALKTVDGDIEGRGKVVRIAPAEGAQHGSLSGVYTARIVLDNERAAWTPGLFVQGTVQIGETVVPLAVKRSGLQSFRDFSAVFEQVGETYEVRMLELGRQDETHAEVLGGIDAGADYVAENSYLIKADIEKSGASHDH